MSFGDGELKLALDALDAKQLPAAAASWDDRLLALLDVSQQAAPMPMRPRRRLTRLRLLAAACLVFVAMVAFVASGAAARIGIPNPIDMIWHRHSTPQTHKTLTPSPSPSPSSSHKQTTPSPTPSRSQSAGHTSKPAVAATSSAALPPAWDGGTAVTLQPRRSGTRADLRGVAFVGSKGWAVGASGTVLTSADGGADWSAQTSGYDDWLFDVAFADDARGWAVGGANGGTIIGTSDGGGTWLQETTTPGALYGVASADAHHAWAVGSRVIAMRDGATWQEQEAPAHEILLDVAAPDERHAWAVGYWGTILATDDGGETWRSQHARADLTLTSVCFLDAKQGWVAGFSGGGLYGCRSVLLATIDGGETWVERGAGDKGTVLDQVVFVDALHGWASGRYQKRTLCLATADGGASWQAWDAPRRSRPVAVAAVGTSVACVVGDSGAVYVVPDGH